MGDADDAYVGATPTETTASAWSGGHNVVRTGFARRASRVRHLVRCRVHALLAAMATALSLHTANRLRRLRFSAECPRTDVAGICKFIWADCGANRHL